MAEPAPRPSVGSYVGLTVGSAVLIVGAVVTASLLRGAFVDAHRTVGWIVACSIVALLIDPLVDALDRFLPRVLSVIVVLLAILGLMTAIGFGVVRELLESLDELRASAPAAAAELEERNEWAAEIGVAARVENFVDDLDSRLRDDAVAEAADAIPAYLVTGILMLFLLAYGRRYIDGFVDQFREERREQLRSVISDAAVRARTYLLAALAHSLVNGCVVASLCWLLDLPAAVSLGVAVGAMTILPLIGVLVGGVPALLLAFGLEGWRTGAVVLAVLVVLQVVEAAIVRPVVDARTVHVGPAVPIVVGLVGFELYGIGGSVYGICLGVLGLAALDAVGRWQE